MHRIRDEIDKIELLSSIDLKILNIGHELPQLNTIKERNQN